MSETRVAVLVGSLREGSLNRRLAHRLLDLAPAGLHLEIVGGLDAVPFYNEDLDAGDPPTAAARLRDAVAAADRILVVTPEYNGTIPAVLKNAIDWLSRPYGRGALVGTPLAVVGVTPTPYGGTWAHQDTVRSTRIAGALPLEDLVVSQSSTDIDVLTDPEVTARLLAVLEHLRDADPQPAAA